MSGSHEVIELPLWVQRFRQSVLDFELEYLRHHLANPLLFPIRLPPREWSGRFDEWRAS